MSLTNVLLIHVSSRCMPRNDAEEKKEQAKEYYALLDLPKYAPIADIRKSYRRITLKIQCDRMMLQWDGGAAPEAQKALEEQESLVKEAFRVLGDKHLRQQYHLLQCRPSRYKMIKGPLAVIHGMTLSRRWFPLLILQSVIVATMVNAVVAQYETQEWVYVLIPVFSYYGMIVLFWIFMLEFPWRRYCTKRSFGAMLCACLQHVCLWNGCFWMARYWDRATGPNITWYILSIPFYLAIIFRCGCTFAAVASLKDLQSKMISRTHLEESTQQQADPESKESSSNGVNNNTLSDGYIVVTQDSTLFKNQLLQLPLSDDDAQDLKLIEAARVETSPEFRQVDHAAKCLHRAAVQLVTLGTTFVTLVALKLEDAFDVSWWLIFAPVWIHLGMRLFVTSRAPNRVPPGSASNSTTTNIHPTTSNDANPTTTTTKDPSTDDGPSTTKTTTVTAEESDNVTPTDEEAPEPKKTMDVASKSLWKGEYTALDVVMDVPTQSIGGEEKAPPTTTLEISEISDDSKSGTEQQQQQEQSLVDTIQLALTAGERDVEAALPLSATSSSLESSDSTAALPTPPLDANASNNNQHHNDDDDEEDGPEVHDEFERWQSVYENQDVRTGHFQFLPCEVLFDILIMCLIVAKLDESYENTSPEGSSFNAFYILLVPFSVGLLVCCCALVAGFLALNTEVAPADGDANLDPTAEGSAAFDANAETDELLPMQAGAKERQEKTFALHIDVTRPELTFSQRVQILTAALPISTAEAETWLSGNHTAFQELFPSTIKSVWEQAVRCASALNCETVNQDEENLVDIGSFDKECILLLRKNLQAHFHKIKFQDELNAIQPLDEDDENDDEDPGTAGIECPVCCEEYDIKDMVHCEGNPIHFFCRVCFHRYATETIQAGDVAGMPCADTNCLATFSTPTVTSNLSQWELLRQRDRENERNQKVALAAKAVLQCTCGAAGIVMEEDVGDGCIKCPGEGCDKEFCALCGNLWHPETSCPPSKKMLQWVVQNTMPCPNCRTPIEKNFGCDHMHCAPPGGCGHHFSYRTGKPMSKHGRSLRGLYN